MTEVVLTDSRRRSKLTRTGHLLAAIIGIWQLGTGLAVVIGGDRRSSTARWEDVLSLLGAVGLPVHAWGWLPLAGGVMLLTGQLATRLPLPDVGVCRGLLFGGYLAGCASAWVLGVSSWLAARDNPEASFTGAFLGLALALPLCVVMAFRTGLSVRAAARTGVTGCRS